MKHTEDIILRLLRIREARRLSESPLASQDDVQILRDFIIENRRQIPSFALSHFDEKNKNIGVCDGCFCFLYLDDEKFHDEDFFARLLNKK